MPTLSFLAGILALFSFEKFFKQEKEAWIHVEHTSFVKVQSVIWKGSLFARGNNMFEATDKLNQDQERILRNFTARGMKQNEIVFHSASSKELDSLGSVELSSNFELRSENIALVHKIIQNSDDLLRFGILIQTEQPFYILESTNLWIYPELKELVQTAKNRAGEILEIQNLYNLNLKQFALLDFNPNAYAPCGFFSAEFSSERMDSIKVNLKAKALIVLN